MQGRCDFCDVDMLLSTHTEGDIPFDDWDQDEHSKQVCSENLDKFLKSTELIIPWKDIPLERLDGLLEMVENYASDDL
jgi:hypothetical protein